VKAISAAVAFVLVLAACGGGGGGGSASREPTASCLRSSGADNVSTAKDDLDYVAQTASAGGIQATVSGTTVTIALGRTEEDAKRLEAAYKIFAEGFGVPVDDVLKRKGNAVIMWDATPTNEQSGKVEDCLKA
jgi:hypothetical protein